LYQGTSSDVPKKLLLKITAALAVPKEHGVYQGTSSDVSKKLSLKITAALAVSKEHGLYQGTSSEPALSLSKGAAYAIPRFVIPTEAG
jgi:hypothetical protein